MQSYLLYHLLLENNGKNAIKMKINCLEKSCFVILIGKIIYQSIRGDEFNPFGFIQRFKLLINYRKI